MRLIIVRHGESEWNRIGRYQGQQDAALSALGTRQAEALAGRLQREPLDAIFTSPLARAAKTAEAIARRHPTVPFEQTAALLEIGHGDWEGLLADEVIAQYDEGLREWRNHPTRSQMPNGESFSNILKRVLDFKEQLCAQFHSRNVLVSTHDVVVKILVADALGMNMDRINRIWVTNASISVIEYGEDLPYLISLSEACHLGRLETVRERQKAIQIERHKTRDTRGEKNWSRVLCLVSRCTGVIMTQPVYCPRCGTLMEQRVVDDRAREVCPACGFIFYRNPVPAVGVVVALDGKLVLIRRRYEPRAGCWALPAGFMELGESAEDAAIRECHEETGLLVRVDHLLGVFSYGEGQRTGLLIIYAATATGGELVAADDATEAGVFALDALPTPMAFPTHLQAIDRWRRETRAAAPYLARTAGDAITVRYASQPDAPATLALLLADLSPDSATYMATEALLHDRLHDPDRPALLAEIDGTIGGVALLGLHQAPRGWYATLDDLVVAPALRRHGLGRVLVKAAASLAQVRGCPLLQLAFPVEDAGARAFLAVCGLHSDAALALRL